MEAVIDTNALVYDSIEDSELHEKAKEQLDGMTRWLVPSVVIEELVFALKEIEVNDRFIGDKLKELLSDERVVITPVESKDIMSALAVLILEKASFARFNDKLILSIAKRRKTSLLTFDRGLQAQSRKAGLHSLP